MAESFVSTEEVVITLGKALNVPLNPDKIANRQLSRMSVNVAEKATKVAHTL